MFKKVGVFLQMIKFEHTVFALPFAFMGALLGSVVMFGELPSWPQIGWIVVAMFGARSAAMGLNRLIDRISDAKNPRTAGRAIPAGLLKVGEVSVFIAISFFLLFWAAFKLNPLSAKLLPVAVFLLVFYSFTKRFTWACHLILGLTIALAPLGGWVAVTGNVDWTAMIFYFTIVFWTAGFDIIYSCQDVEFDKKEGLYSIPVRFGVARALFIAKAFHILTGIGFISLLFMADLSWWYVAGMIIAYIILFYEHHIVSPSDLSRLQTAFFTMNGVLSIVVFSFTLIDLVVQFR
ncbi:MULTISPECIES: UbiA-like polyprenyltransferase [unclassified Paenibacillus]|uniref:UbiA-like polyprenyltransferase n=1 Tax=unclassified Paenibacillus TaxID=185978 RepID=UPI0024065B0C|nr:MULTISPECIES: UbiA-like polyprenyltransferase [unclassified Paenibacillus]MDF9840325.1 4-hydroxybenzoate polyprenyltransferase [Paenibacillus sp. PastF-2]MDF9846907.1 4-hydroxybenzoate polyprenyltransferase [Paenibacillus sp. PastM-2]MDF9853479.1 4-hydroxybenzoate polyprenyltransferase [Paenibacillus sp. PastF-1]MDH6479034.1 4-hydroxybenzoate polyprenyltransferase [Paenibacillus sp. PastH-2]MDH6506766.1 4-hydroxybenzoate polyprenyltransferase [Paenibacillus sp. PastM-3]